MTINDVLERILNDTGGMEIGEVRDLAPFFQGGEHLIAFALSAEVPAPESIALDQGDFHILDFHLESKEPREPHLVTEFKVKRFQ